MSTEFMPDGTPVKVRHRPTGAVLDGKVVGRAINGDNELVAKVELSDGKVIELPLAVLVPAGARGAT